MKQLKDKIAILTGWIILLLTCTINHTACGNDSDESSSDLDADSDADSDIDTDTDSDSDTDTDSIGDPPPGCEGVIAFPDPYLEAAIREEIHLPSGDIHYSDLAAVTILTATGSAGKPGISDLTNIHCLDNLTGIYLWHNQISDLGPLSTLTALEFLAAYDNQIDDLSPLSELSGLIYLYLHENQIGDISPLSGLTNLEDLNLDENQISDIGPLVDNPGLGNGDRVWIRENALECDKEDLEDIAILEKRGVDLLDQC